MNPPSHENSTEAGIIRQQVSLLVDEVSKLSRGDLPPQEFHREALHRAVRATNALQASLWLNSAEPERPSFSVQPQHSDQNDPASEREQSDFRAAPAICVCTVRDEKVSTGTSVNSNVSWQNTVVATALNAGKIQHVSPGSGSNRQISMNPTDCFVVAVPFQIEAGSGGAMVMIYDQSSKPAFLQGAAQVVTVFCELIGDYHRNQCLLELRRQQRQ